MRRLRFFNLAANRTQCVLAACAYNLRRMRGPVPADGRPHEEESPKIRQTGLFEGPRG